MAASGTADGSYIRDYEAADNIQVFRNGVWEIVNGSAGNSGKQFGTGSVSYNSGIVTLNNLNLSGCTAI